MICSRSDVRPKFVISIRMQRHEVRSFYYFPLESEW